MFGMRKIRHTPFTRADWKKSKQDIFHKVTNWVDRKLRPGRYKPVISSDQYAAKIGYAKSAEEYEKRHGVVTRRDLPRDAEIQGTVLDDGSVEILRIRKKTPSQRKKK